ncbi:MAG: DeoR/GlpR family DNA-binding transcription regulator [Clostridiales bacterium]|nr:DeoR/GlpR family DNA-binding transcription regulator [Clostridiales bacterium]
MAQKGRLATIRQTVKRDRRVTVAQLSQEYNVTEETIRRDLEKLEQEGLVARTYGGAVLNVENVSENIDYLRRAQTNREEKTAIGKLVAEVIPERATVGADASSTVMEAVRFLKDRSEITVLTNSVQIVRELNESAINIVSTGGIVNKNTYSMQGKIVRRILSEYYVDIILVSCKALEMEGGIFDSNEEEAEIKRALIERGQKIILLADHSKFDRVAFVRLLDFDKIDMIVTDREPSEEWKKKLAEKGIELLFP